MCIHIRELFYQFKHVGIELLTALFLPFIARYPKKYVTLPSIFRFNHIESHESFDYDIFPTLYVKEIVCKNNPSIDNVKLFNPEYINEYNMLQKKYILNQCTYWSLNLYNIMRTLYS